VATAMAIRPRKRLGEMLMERNLLQPDELDIALAIDRIERATTMRVGRIIRKWAGLRSFVADGVPVAGYDPEVDGFFWLAGQGGYGIETSPALAHVAAALAREEELPADIQALGVSSDDLAPARVQDPARRATLAH